MDSLDNRLFLLESYYIKDNCAGLRVNRQLDLIKKNKIEYKNVVITDKNEEYKNILIDNFNIFKIINKKMIWFLAPIITFIIFHRENRIKKIFAINLTMGWVAFFFKKIFNVSYVLDLHGAIPEEVYYNRNNIFQYKFLKIIEKYVVENSSKLIVVSNAMKEYYISSYDLKNKEIEVMPNCVEDWFISKKDIIMNRRFKFRKELDVEEKFVFVYSGSSTKWQKPKKMLKVFKRIDESTDLKCHFLILTKDKVEFENLVEKNNISMDNITIKKVSHSEMPKYIACGDLGVSIRDNNIINQVACPTKIPEYLACGLPLLLTDNIGDFTKLISERDIGITIDINDIKLDKILDYIYLIKNDRDKFIDSSLEVVNDFFVWNEYSNII